MKTFLSQHTYLIASTSASTAIPMQMNENFIASSHSISVLGP